MDDLDFILRQATHGERLYTTAAPCRIHFIHKPRSHQNHRHHIWPLGLGGPDIEENIVVSCPTGHYSIHVLLNAWIKADKAPPWSYRRTFARGEQMYAELGFDRYKAQDMLLPLNY